MQHLLYPVDSEFRGRRADHAGDVLGVDAMDGGLVRLAAGPEAGAFEAAGQEAVVGALRVGSLQRQKQLGMSLTEPGQQLRVVLRMGGEVAFAHGFAQPR